VTSAEILQLLEARLLAGKTRKKAKGSGGNDTDEDEDEDEGGEGKRCVTTGLSGAMM